ncbi:hypothetical protein EYZ11_009960 [Aspergillus tanneri]|uniref:Alpha/beta hydrolase fold-3 domain-containing protein n=1 Tax=Aspergillus tanneri TaxID=1220188 RepID=A0A4S3JBX7_9EURO|nr:uncharacterized protein ATNIH1004_005466 [Aspergillus tanneri]KAA8646791.1 hypothetical protein ATNIH1004_005466 [Aspergillus tanneri]THC90581.1 hypothetical protein EYZ11_009960 [Aspergillus tanneri]
MLTYDPEFAAAAGPLLHQHVQQDQSPNLAATQAKMHAMCDMVPSQPCPDEVEQLVHQAPAVDSHQITVYHYRLKRNEGSPSKTPAVVHMHGGGYVALTAQQTATAQFTLTAHTGVPVLSIEYRRAPEHPYPTPLDDCWAALLWIVTHADMLAIDVHRIAVMGESAGGGLAAALALLARDRGLSPPLAKQILVYPCLDDRTRTNPVGEFAFWTEHDNVNAWTAYLGNRAGTEDVPAYAAPARVQSVEGLPPLYLDCPQLDLFLSESCEYVRRFLEANISVEFHIYPGLPHGFEAFAPTSGPVQRACMNRFRAVASLYDEIQ